MLPDYDLYIGLQWLIVPSIIGIYWWCQFQQLLSQSVRMEKDLKDQLRTNFQLRCISAISAAAVAMVYFDNAVIAGGFGLAVFNRWYSSTAFEMQIPASFTDRGAMMLRDLFQTFQAFSFGRSFGMGIYLRHAIVEGLPFLLITVGDRLDYPTTISATITYMCPIVIVFFMSRASDHINRKVEKKLALLPTDPFVDGHDDGDAKTMSFLNGLATLWVMTYPIALLALAIIVAKF